MDIFGKRTSRFLVLMVVMMLAACGGGGGASDGGTGESGTGDAYNGANSLRLAAVVNMGVVVGGSVAVNRFVNGAIGPEVVSPLVSDQDGLIDLSAAADAYSGPAILTLSDPSGTTRYFNEASGTMTAFPARKVLHAVVPHLDGTPIAITPLTEVATQMAMELVVSQGLGDAAAITEANSKTSQAFLGGIDPLYTIPVDVRRHNAAASNNAAVYANVLAGIAYVAQLNGIDPIDQAAVYATNLKSNNANFLQNDLGQLILAIAHFNQSPPPNVFVPQVDTNVMPVAFGQNVALDEDTSADVVLHGGDLNQLPVLFTIDTQPQFGQLTGTPPNLTYIPNHDFNGSDSFRFVVNNGFMTSSPTLVNIHVNAVADAPIAADSVFLTAENTAGSGTMRASDADNDALTYSIVAQPAHGIITSINQTTGDFVYSPDRYFSGTDSFTFKASDATSSSNVATMSVTVQNVNNPPVAAAALVTLGEDTATAITLSGTDADGNPLQYVLSSMPAHGTLSGILPNVVYTPDVNYNGQDSFSFYVSDGALNSSEAVVSLKITPVNDPPVAFDRTQTHGVLLTTENTAATGTLPATDADGDALTYAIVAQPAHGIIQSINPSTGEFVYVPHTGYSGADSFTFQVSDGTSSSNVATMNVTVQDVNDKPVADAALVTLAEDTPTNITLSGTDADGNSLTYVISGMPAHGTLSGTLPNVIYTPDLNYNGQDSFKFYVNDGSLDSSEAVVSLKITPVNDAPVASNTGQTPGVLLTTEGTAGSGKLPATDADNDALTYTIVTQPSHGTISSFNQATGEFVYTPNAGYSGTDSFTYKVSDGTAESGVATMTVTVQDVNNPPVAQAALVTLNEDTPTALTLVGTDADGSTLQYVLSGMPAHGTLAGTLPNVTYTPDLNYNGQDSFKFYVNDGSLDSSEAVVSLKINPVNDPPVASNPGQTLGVLLTTEGTAGSGKLPAFDVDNDALVYIIVTQPSHGTITSFNQATGEFVYTPNTGYSGTDSFTYKVSDGAAVSGIATMNVTVQDVNNEPVAEAALVSLNEDTPTAITLVGTDADGNALQYVLSSMPAHGTLSGTLPDVTYTPDRNYNGQDSFRFYVTDSNLKSSDAVVSLKVNPVNDAPVASDQSLKLGVVMTAENTAVSGTLPATDADNDPLTFAIVAPPTNGTLQSFNPATGAFVYVPNTNFSGADSFTFKANDGALDSNVGTVNVSVQDVNNPPAAAAALVSLNEDTATAITLSGSDPDGDALNYVLSSMPAHGTLSGTLPDVTYTPDRNYDGQDSFRFYVTDGKLNSSDAVVSLKVNPVNDAPVASDQSLKFGVVLTAENTAVSGTLPATDADNDPLTFTIVAPPTNGTLQSFNPATGAFVYVPNTNFSGADSFTFTANDGTLDSNVGTVNVSVQAVNNAPAADAALVSLNEDTATAVTLSGSDPDGDALTYVLSSMPAHGTLSGTLPDLTYTPDLNYNGQDSFRFYVRDGALNSSEAVVSLKVTAVNDAPVAINRSLTLNQGASVSFTLDGGDPENDSLTYTVTTAPATGTTSGAMSGSLAGMSPLEFTPARDFSGQEQLVFTLDDGHGGTAQGTVTFTVLPYDQSSQDSDGDGLRDSEEIAYGTNPNLADTDGDGFSDYQEIVTYAFDANVNNLRFNPLIADTPKIQIKITSAPDFSLNYTLDSGTTDSISTNNSSTTGTSVSTSESNENTNSVAYANTVGGEVTVAYSAKDGWGGSATASYSHEESVSNDSTVAFSTENVKENSTTLDKGREFEKSNNVSYSDGSIDVTVQITNSGHIAYTLENLLLSAVTVSKGPNGMEFGSVGQMAFNDIGSDLFPSTTLGPGQTTAQLNFSAPSVDIGSIESLMADSTALTITPATFDLLDPNGVPYNFASTNIGTQCATVIVDFLNEGGKKTIEEAVAVHGDPGHNVTLLDALQKILRLDTVIAATDGSTQDADGNPVVAGSIYSIDGLADNGQYAHWIVVHGKQSGNDQINTVVYTTPDEVARWQAKGATPAGNLVGDVDFSQVVLNAGDILHFVYLRDDDLDGLSNSEEFLAGTNPQLSDSDSDGLDDKTELTGWDVAYKDAVGADRTIHVYPDPNNPDSDGDGLTDAEEANLVSGVPNPDPSLRRDPTSSDTDGDGLGDATDDLAGGTFAANAYDSVLPDTLSISLDAVQHAWVNFNLPAIYQDLSTYDVVVLKQVYAQGATPNAEPFVMPADNSGYSPQLGDLLPCTNSPSCQWTVAGVAHYEGASASYLPVGKFVFVDAVNTPLKVQLYDGVDSVPTNGSIVYRIMIGADDRYQVVPGDLYASVNTNTFEITLKPGSYSKRTERGYHGNIYSVNAAIPMLDTTNGNDAYNKLNQWYTNIPGSSSVQGWDVARSHYWGVNDNPSNKAYYRFDDRRSVPDWGQNWIDDIYHVYDLQTQSEASTPWLTDHAWDPWTGGNPDDYHAKKFDYVYAENADLNGFLYKSQVGDGQLDLNWKLSFGTATSQGTLFQSTDYAIDGTLQTERLPAVPRTGSTKTTVSLSTFDIFTGGTNTVTGGANNGVFSVDVLAPGYGAICHVVKLKLAEVETKRNNGVTARAPTQGDFAVTICPDLQIAGNWTVSSGSTTVSLRPNNANYASLPVAMSWGEPTVATVNTTMEIRIPR